VTLTRSGEYWKSRELRKGCCTSAGSGVQAEPCLDGGNDVVSENYLLATIFLEASPFYCLQIHSLAH
jgi:hypothetical protein